MSEEWPSNVAATLPSVDSRLWLAVLNMSVGLSRRLRGTLGREVAVDHRQSDGGDDEGEVDHRLPKHRLGGVVGRVDEGLQEVDRGDADDCHRKLYLEDVGVHVGEPLRLIGVVAEVDAGDEALVAADDHHDQEVGDHHHVNEPEDEEHHVVLAEVADVADQVPELLHEAPDVDALGGDQPQVERRLQPAADEDRAADGARQRSVDVGFGGDGRRILAGSS